MSPSPPAHRRAAPFIPWLLPAFLLLAGCRSAGVQGASLHLQAGRFEEAEVQLRAAVAEDPSNPEARFLLGVALAEQGKAVEADSEFTRTTGLDDGYRLRVEELRTRFARRFQDDALSLLREDRADEAGGAVAAAEAMRPGLGRTLWVRGRLAAAEGRVDDALRLHREAAGRDPEDRDIRSDLVAALIAAADAGEDAGRVEEALALLGEVLALERRPDLLHRQGELAYRLAEQAGGAARLEWLTLSAEAFRGALQDAPEDREAAYNLGAVLLAAERYPEAVGLYRSLLARDPRDAEVYLALAIAHRGTGERALADAEEAAGRALDARDPVEDPAGWARRAAERFPAADLAAVHAELGAPEAVYTCREGRDLVEAWYYWKLKRVAAFRDGRRVGEMLRLP